jgi:tight adherence protein B
VTGLLFAFAFASGVGLIWAGAVCGVDLRRAGWERVWRSGAVAELPMPAPLFFLLVVGSALVAAALAWSLVSIPVLAVVGGLAGVYVPFAWLRRRRERRRHGRERAWPATLAQLADALEAGLAFPAGVALVAESGPTALRPELAAFHARLRAGGLAAALEGLSEVGERTADTVVVFLRAGLLELPAGGLAPLLRELSQVLAERLEAREKARSRAATLQLEAAILAVSPIALLLLIGAASPGYLDAYRTAAGSLVGAFGALFIFGCYLLMRRLGRVPEPRRIGADG